jgi:hypothetical protein
MNKLTINSNFKFDVMKNLLAPDNYDFYIVFSRDYTRGTSQATVSPRDTLNSIFNKSTPEIKLMYIKKIKTTIDTEIENIEDTEIFGAIRKDKDSVPTNNYTGPAYLTFQSDSSFTLEVNNNTKNWDGTLYYSTDLETWYEWDGTTINSVDNKLYLRGTENTVITGNNQNHRWVLTSSNDSNIKCIGNIENLLDWEAVESGSHPSMASYCYAYMFYGCTALVSPPALHATTLASSCYRSMFHGCAALVSAPALPATTLASDCYNSMFYGCTSLKISSAPTGAYQYAWRIPTSGTATTANNWNFLMLSGTGGTFKTNPSINKTYYVENLPVSALSATDFPSDYYYVACNNINTETVDLTHIYFRVSIEALNDPDLQSFNIVTLIYCDHSTDDPEDLSEDYTDGTAQPDSNPFTAEGVNARIFAQIKPATQFMTQYDPENVAPDSIPKLQLMIEL